MIKSESVRWQSQRLGASGSAVRRPQRRGRLVAFRSSAGGFEGDSPVVFPQSLVLLWRQKGQVTDQGDQNNSTSCIFLHRFVESERDF